MKYVLRAWGQSEREFEVLALGGKLFSGHGGQLKRGLEVLALCGMCFEGMGAVEKGV